MTIISVLLISLLYFVCLNIISKAVTRIGDRKSVNSYRMKYISKTINGALMLLFLMIIFFILGIEYSQVSLFVSSFFAVVGIAFFAQWSILSNITASLIIFFAFPYRVGDRIRIADKDEELSGEIIEISLFHVIIKKESEIITYPNNLILQKAVIKLSGDQCE